MLDAAGLGNFATDLFDDDTQYIIPRGDDAVDMMDQGWWGPSPPAVQKTCPSANKSNTWCHCVAVGNATGQFSIPRNFTTSGSGNNGATLMLNATHVAQTQPLFRCAPGAPLLSRWKSWMMSPNPPGVPPDRYVMSLFGNGYYGAHGGSGLSSLGGMIRLGELNASAPPISHALGIELFAHHYYFCRDKTNRSSCYRWPAITADSYAVQRDSPLVYGGTVPSIQPGSLLTVPQAAVASLRKAMTTVVGARVLQAISTFGAYLVDDAAGSYFANGNGKTNLNYEQGVRDEVTDLYGLDLNAEANSSNPLFDDFTAIFRQLHAVSNNRPGNIGGGGEPIAPVPPELCPLPPSVASGRAAATAVAAAVMAERPMLVGAHYFGGWNPGPYSHWLDPGSGPLGHRTSWVPRFPGRVPLLGNYTTDRRTVEAELKAADKYLDYLEVLWSDPRMVGSDTECLWPTDPNLRPCTDTPLAIMLNTSVWNTLTGRLGLIVSYSNDFDSSAKPSAAGMFAGASGLRLWQSFVATWVSAMQHPHYFRVDGRPVFKILGPYNFHAVQCGNNATLAQVLIDVLRGAARDAGVGDLLVGGGWAPLDGPDPSPYQGVAYDFTGTYNGGQPPHCDTAAVSPFASLSSFQAESWGNHSDDPVPWVPNIVSSFDPRPAREAGACSYKFPTEAEWTAELTLVRERLFSSANRYGFPSSSSPRGVRPAVSIYAWNEYAEGGIVAPTEGSGYMMLDVIRKVFS